MENVRISWLHQEYTPESQIGFKVVNNNNNNNIK